MEVLHGGEEVTIVTEPFIVVVGGVNDFDGSFVDEVELEGVFGEAGAGIAALEVGRVQLDNEFTEELPEIGEVTSGASFKMSIRKIEVLIEMVGVVALREVVGNSLDDFRFV